jgi:hypothetical protein
MGPLKINVTGSGTATRLAERATLVVQVQSQPKLTVQDASAALPPSISKLIETIAPYCPQDEKTGQKKEVASISHYFVDIRDVSNHRDRQSDTSSSFMSVSSKSIVTNTYCAKADIYIVFIDFVALAYMASHLSAMDNVSVQRVTWSLSEAAKDEVAGIARKAAAKNALQRARDYAEVFADLSADEAVRQVKAVDLKEDAKYENKTKPRMYFGRRPNVKTIAVQGQAEVQLEPVDVVVEVKIEGKFVVEG